jgi:hypothetical protein
MALDRVLHRYSVLEEPMKPRIGEVLLALLAMGAAFALDASFASVGGIFAKPQLALACHDGCN